MSTLRLVDVRELHRHWEPQQLRTLLRFYDVDCVFDVGANVGQYARMLRHAAGYRGRIISFEPNPAAAGRLLMLAERDPLWTVEQIAVSFADGSQPFNIMADSQFSSLSPPTHEHTQLFTHLNSVSTTIDVTAETLTTAYERLVAAYGFRRPFLKLDTQGYDVEIVRHAGPALAQFIGLQSELAVTRLYEHSVDFREALSVYESKGFRLSAFVPNNAGHFPRLVETDCIMVRRDLIEQRPEGDGA